eukprot:TRINITY_DN6252_c0_g1_i2.p1 TRINITY_DN6252_c0_g1~~TRINITY_DN6252_c0_g1_i2.p1  ORF type:complete len:365 (+),score=105.29 TRINITY_DN6252_c0_g1_i2:125-1219(+)
MIRRPPRSTLSSSSAASDVYKRQYQRRVRGALPPSMPRQNLTLVLRINVDAIKRWLKYSVIIIAAWIFLKRAALVAIRSKKSVRGRLVLITGAAGGLGSQLARAFAKQGANLVLWDRPGREVEQTLAQLVEDLEQEFDGIKAWFYLADITDRKVVYQLSSQVALDCGTVYCLVNCAGVMAGASLLESKDENIERTLKVNTLSHFWMTKAFLPGMMREKIGHVVTISSFAGVQGSPQLIDYSASKFAANGFAESLRLELATEDADIGSTLICPGHIKTPLFKGYGIHWLAQLLVPSLEPAYVAERVVQAVEADETVVYMPAMCSFVPIQKALFPTALFDWVSNVMGLSTAMQNIDLTHNKKQFGS